MKKFILMMTLIISVLVSGIFIGKWWFAGQAMQTAAPVQAEKKVLYWKAPMDANYRRDTPGKSPMGMDLVPVYANDSMEENMPEGTVSIAPNIINSLGVRSTLVKQGSLTRRIETVGYVSYDEDSLHQINTRVEGWVEKLAVKNTGDPIKKGQVLFQLYSPTLVNAQEEYLAALKSSNAMLHKASRKRLKALGVTTYEIDRLTKNRIVKQRTPVYAQSDGVVAHMGVREGSFVKPATEIMSIAKLDKVWVMVEVFERQAAWVELGQRAEVSMDYLPGQRLFATVDYIYPELDPKSRTLKVRLRLDNKKESLRPNMFGRVSLLSAETGSIVHVPREVVIRGGASNRVVLDLGDGRFRAHVVTLGREIGERLEILSGLAAGDRVVTSGQFLIDSESNIDSALARLDSDDSVSTMQTINKLKHEHVKATVIKVDADAKNISLKHDPIPAWSWPSMTMDFSVSNEHLLMGLTDGQEIEVTIEKNADTYLITDVMKSDKEHIQ